MTRILIVDDEPAIVRALSINLRAAGYDVLTAGDAEEALAHAENGKPDVIVLDLGLPDLDGVDVIARLRATSTVPILVLSGRSDSSDKVEALDAGADDYVTKPFGVDELLARLRVMERRGPIVASDAQGASGTPQDSRWPQLQQTVRGKPIEFGHASVSLTEHRVRVGGVDVRLTPTEWHLLEVFLARPGVLISQADLLHEVWGPGYESAQGNLRLYINQLRRKLEPDPSQPRHILNEPGLGYRFQP